MGYITAIVVSIIVIVWHYRSVARIEREAKKEALDKFIDKNKELHKRSFRTGDRVYVENDLKFEAGKPYYLIQPYNDGNCYYIDEKPDAVIAHYNERQSACHVINMRHERTEQCWHCKQFLPVNK